VCARCFGPCAVRVWPVSCFGCGGGALFRHLAITRWALGVLCWVAFVACHHRPGLSLASCWGPCRRVLYVSARPAETTSSSIGCWWAARFFVRSAFICRPSLAGREIVPPCVIVPCDISRWRGVAVSTSGSGGRVRRSFDPYLVEAGACDVSFIALATSVISSMVHCDGSSSRGCRGIYWSIV